MADFCYGCTETKLGVDGSMNDFADMITKAESDKGTVAEVLCEGCGEMIHVDYEGKKVEKKHA